MSEVNAQPEQVTLSIDGREISVPKGMNLIEAAKVAGIEIPHYCYHTHLSVAGNCRMCQVKVEGMPKLTIGCNTGATEGMKVSTHLTSPEVAEAQRATLEFILINHPLDCTVCDQAGHCKLQDYYYEYNRQPSRFAEEDKEHKVKALPLGPNVILDGERCILCTRCVRFCEEITETAELGVFNRGDKSVISVAEGEQLDNPLSGSVVDLCPVGALTHRNWRFNTRIWYTKPVDSVCPGCSTGCNVKISTRDEQVVHVKARLNAEVNREWLCDEGRYGFDRLVAGEQLSTPLVIKDSGEGARTTLADIAAAMQSVKAGANETAVFLSPLLTIEDLYVAEKFLLDVLKIEAGSSSVAMQYKSRQLDAVSQKLVSPDFAPNARAASLFGWAGSGENWREEMTSRYEALLGSLVAGKVKRLIMIGDAAIAPIDAERISEQVVSQLEFSLALVSGSSSDANNEEFVNGPFSSRAVIRTAQYLVPVLGVLEKQGLYLNRDQRLQRLIAPLAPRAGVRSEWQVLAELARVSGVTLLSDNVVSARDLLLHMGRSDSRFAEVTPTRVGSFGIRLASA